MKGRSGKSRSVRTMCSGAADQRPRTKSKNARAVFLYSEPNRRAMAALPAIITSPEIRYLLAAILILTGLALAFWGHGLWATVMSMIGALLGAVVGYLFGAALGGDLTGLILAIVGAVIGSILFTKLVKVATLTAALAGLGVFALGAFMQTAALRRKRRARAAAGTAAAPPPPPSS